jgi:RNA polymerase sigma-70 factor, ECF subfamily
MTDRVILRAAIPALNRGIRLGSLPGTALSPRVAPTRVSNLQDLDQALLDRIRAGDQGAFELLVRTHSLALLRFARAQLQDESDAEDVVHDVFVRLWGDRERMGGDRSVRAYLLAAVRNRVIDKLRRYKLERRWTQPMPSGEEGREGNPVAAIPDPVLESDPASLAELDAAIRLAVADLPERGRTAFLLCREEGLSYAEAAEVMGVSTGTVKTHMVRALAALRTALQPFLTLIIALPQFLR